jgi:hypothetical protein
MPHSGDIGSGSRREAATSPFWIAPTKILDFAVHGPT